MTSPGLQLETNVPQDGPDEDTSFEAAPSSPSRVPVNFFDPVGVSELKRTMTMRSTRSQTTQAHHQSSHGHARRQSSHGHARRQSSQVQARRRSSPPPTIPSPPIKVDSLASSSVIDGEDDSFDFERTLKNLIRR